MITATGRGWGKPQRPPRIEPPVSPFLLRESDGSLLCRRSIALRTGLSTTGSGDTAWRLSGRRLPLAARRAIQRQDRSVGSFAQFLPDTPPAGIAHRSLKALRAPFSRGATGHFNAATARGSFLRNPPGGEFGPHFLPVSAPRIPVLTSYPGRLAGRRTARRRRHRRDRRKEQCD
jgi:hypothetical protein